MSFLAALMTVLLVTPLFYALAWVVATIEGMATPPQLQSLRSATGAARQAVPGVLGVVGVVWGVLRVGFPAVVGWIMLAEYAAVLVSLAGRALAS